LGHLTAKVDQVKFDVKELHAHPELAAKQRMVDDASGDVKVQKKNMCRNTHHMAKMKTKTTPYTCKTSVTLVQVKEKKKPLFV